MCYGISPLAIPPHYTGDITLCVIKTSFNGWKRNMAGHWTCGLYFHLLMARENVVPPTPAKSCHIILPAIE